jgi:hypothetical protein
VVGLLAILGVYLMSPDEPADETARTVVIHTMSGEQWVYDLGGTRTVEIDGPGGKTQILITDGGVRFTASPCPHKLCVRRGMITRVGEWIACLPNGVAAKISGEAPYDGITP